MPKPEVQQRGLTLFTVHVRRTGPDQQDQKLNSHSKLNCILACIQAAKAGADEALMLDPRGHVATCNSTHFFIVRRGELWTSSGMYCLGGITRGNVLRVAREAGIPAFEKDFSLMDVYGADEAFVTGTFAGLTPVVEVDGRRTRPPDAPSASCRRRLGCRSHDTPTDCALQRARRARDRAAMTVTRRHRSHRHVVGAAQHLDGDDARVREPARHGGVGRAVLRGRAGRHRARPSDARAR